MSDLPITEGEVAFDAPNAGKPCTTWYKIVGDLKAGPAPLVVLHGGPGAGHRYMLPLVDLWTSRGVPVVFYDQIGSGRSTHLRERPGDTEFWTFDLYIAELENLLAHLGLRDPAGPGYCLLGQSWGGMVCGAFAARRPPGLRRVILAGGPASVPRVVEGYGPLMAALPEDVRTTIEECTKRGDFESEEFEKAAAVFYARHVCRLDPMPEDMQDAFANLKDDPTAYLTLQGPSEFIIVGSFKDWECPDIDKIQAETLLINGQYDEVTDHCMEPWFTSIPKVKWVTLENASHMTPLGAEGTVYGDCW